jgi:hypothetical protein
LSISVHQRPLIFDAGIAHHFNNSSLISLYNDESFISNFNECRVQCHMDVVCTQKYSIQMLLNMS